ncbi:MAG: tetratricopeptide repeat protein, partial [Sphingobacteriales bacterium]
MRVILLLISGWVLPALLHAQNSSLTKENKAAQDTVTAKQWVLKAEYYRFYKPDSALYFIDRVLQLPQGPSLNKYIAAAYNSKGYATYMKAQYNEAINAFRNYYNYSKRDNNAINMAYALNNEGNVYIELGDYSTALNKYREALKLRQDINDLHGIAMSYNNFGFIYKDIGDYEKAIANFYAALRVFEKEKDELSIATTYNYLGAVYFRQKNFTEAISIQKIALQKQEALKDLNGQGISLQSIANAYSEMNDYELAIEYYNSAIKIYERSNDLRQLGLLYASMGQLYNKQKKYDAGLASLEKSLEIHSRINNKRSLASTQLTTALTHINLENPVAARLLLDSASKIILLTGNKTDKKNLYEAEAIYYESINELKNALQAYKNYNTEKDSLLNSETMKAMTDVKIKYETEKKDLEINILNKQDSIKSLHLKVQEAAINQQLLTITQQQLSLTENDLEIEAKEKRILQGQIDSSKKAQEIEALNRQTKIQNLELLNQKLLLRNQNYIILVVSIISLSVMLIAYSYYRRYRLKKEKELQAAIFQQQDMATKAVMEAEET